MKTTPFYLNNACFNTLSNIIHIYCLPLIPLKYIMKMCAITAWLSWECLIWIGRFYTAVLFLLRSLGQWWYVSNQSQPIKWLSSIVETLLHFKVSANTRHLTDKGYGEEMTWSYKIWISLRFKGAYLGNGILYQKIIKWVANLNMCSFHACLKLVVWWGIYWENLGVKKRQQKVWLHVRFEFQALLLYYIASVDLESFYNCIFLV